MKETCLLVLLGSIFVFSGCGQPGDASDNNARVSPAASQTAAPTPTQELSPHQERLQGVESGLIPITAEGQPDWDEVRTLAERMDHYLTPGISIAVIDNYQIDWVKGYGVTELGGDEKVTPDNLFHAGSIAKPVSAAAVLSLVESGLLGLHDNVNETLQSWKVPENDYTTEEKVTIRRLLSHSAGLQDGFTGRSSSEQRPAYLTDAGKAPTVTLEQLLDGGSEVDVDGATTVASIPGTMYRYANSDYAVIELLVEDVVQQPFHEFMQETVLEPLGMTGSTYAQPIPAELRQRAVTEHDFQGRPLEGERLHFPFRAAGGLWTTPADLARFAIEIMQAYRGQSDALLSHEMAGEMLAPQIEIPNGTISEYYGLGFELSGEGQDLAVLHTGGTWGSTSLLWFYPETGQGAVIMTNSASGQGAIRFEILFSIAKAYGWEMDLGG